MTSPLLEWRPIDSAPKNRTRILLSDGDQVSTGFWLREVSRWVFDQNWSYPGDAVDFQPSYWLPLPAPPKAEKAP